MKKVLFLSIAFILSLIGNVNAQMSEEMQASKERYVKLEKLKSPGEVGSPNVDALAASSTLVLATSLDITPKLENLYYRSLGQSEDGVIDVTVKKPTLEECVALSETIALQTLAVKVATESIDGAANEVKEIKNPMKAGKAAKSLSYSKDVLSIVGLESTYQVKAIAEIIETVKTGDNL